MSNSFLFATVTFYVILQDTLEVQLLKKITLNGVSFIRIQNYTNETLPSFRKEGDFSLGLDILMMADYSTLQGFIDISEGDARMGEMHTKEYLKALFEQVKIIYNDNKIGKQVIQLAMVGTFVALREDDCPVLYALRESAEEMTSYNSTFNDTTIGIGFEETNSTELSLSIPAVEALDKFTNWLREHDPLLPKHDHAILITKFDLLSPRGDSSTQGMAYVGNICKTGDSASIVEDVGAAATAIIAAHELGHSLGAYHDGNPESGDCLSSDNFLMASAVSGSEEFDRFTNSRLMSPCSVRSIEMNLKTPSAQCVRKTSGQNRIEKSAPQEIISRAPGEIIGLRQQCQITFGPQYGVCPNKEYFLERNICGRVWCKDRSQRKSEPCETKTYFPALDGTECGRAKWCVGGRCVENPKVLRDCVDLNEKTCRKYSKAKLRHYCNAKEFEEICCRSCKLLKDL